MNDSPLQSFVKSVFGTQPSLNTTVANMVWMKKPVTQPMASWQDCPTHTVNGGRRRRPSTERQEELLQMYRQACEAFTAHDMERALCLSDAVIGDIGTDGHLFCSRLRADCQLLRLCATPEGTTETIQSQLETIDELSRDYRADRDRLGFATAQSMAVQLHRALAWIDPIRDSKHFKEAFRALNNVRESLSHRYSSEHEKIVTGLRHLETFQRTRLYNEAGQYREEFDQLELLRESALRIPGGLGLVERVRSEASHYMESEQPDYDRAKMSLAELAWLVDHVHNCPRVAMFCLLGRVSRLCKLTCVRFDRRELDTLVRGLSTPSDTDYIASLHRRFKHHCYDSDRWEQMAARACFVVRTSSIYLEAKFSERY